jgi:hypothetical protein
MFLHGCFQAQEAFLTVQTCVVDREGMQQLLHIMQQVAKLENGEFINNSANSASGLRATGADNRLNEDASLAIDAHIELGRGAGVTASNLGLRPYQVAFGFTEGSYPAETHRLADRLVRELSQHWHVEKVPQGQGVVPMDSCGR